MRKTERICIPAIRYKGKNYTGARHYSIRESIRTELGIARLTGRVIEGFITDRDRFVNRKQAAHIAYRAGQTDVLYLELFSEDIVDTRRF